jgi:hypothetical protein
LLQLGAQAGPPLVLELEDEAVDDALDVAEAVDEATLDEDVAVLLAVATALALLDDEPPCPPQAQVPKPDPSCLQTWTPDGSPPGHAQLTWAPGAHTRPPPVPAALEDVAELVPQPAAAATAATQHPRRFQ